MTLLGRLMLSTAIGLMSSAAIGELLGPRSLERLSEQAAWVGVVEITRGEVLVLDNQVCGAKYRAKVHRVLRGADTTGVIEFGFALNYMIGAKYIVFLSNRYPDIDELSPRAPTAQDRAHYTGCAKFWPQHYAIDNMAVREELGGDRAKPVLVDRAIVEQGAWQLPKDVRLRLDANTDQVRKRSGRIDLDDIQKYLRRNPKPPT